MRVEPGQIWTCGKYITSKITKVEFGLATMIDDDGKEYQIDCRILLDEHMFGARIGNGWKMIQPAEKSCSHCDGAGGSCSYYPEDPCPECGKTCFDD